MSKKKGLTEPGVQLSQQAGISRANIFWIRKKVEGVLTRVNALLSRWMFCQSDRVLLMVVGELLWRKHDVLEEQSAKS